MAPMVLLFVALLSSAILAPTAALPGRATTVIGGATSIVEAAAGLNSRCKSKAGYMSVGSGAGITSFNNGSYAVALSDQPMTLLQENAVGSVSKLYGKCTIPVLLARYGFFIKAANPNAFIKLSAAQTYAIYKSGGSWKKYTKAVSGAITRFARAEGSGTTFVVKRYWFVGNTKFIADYPSALNGDPMPFPGLVLVAGTKAMCTGAAGKLGAIAYAQVGVCDSIAPGLVEVALQQKSGAFITPSNGAGAAAIPRILPPNCASWSNVANSMILQKGPKTPPIVSFEYAFIRHKGLSHAGPNGALGKKLLLCWLSNVNALAANYLFDQLPPSILKRALATVHAVGK